MFRCLTFLAFIIAFALERYINFASIWFSHFAIGLIISYLIKIHINEHKNTMEFTRTLPKTLESKDTVLNKPVKLTREEYISIQQHPVIGFDMLKLIDSFEQNKILEMVLYHHERYDGQGYPQGLRGEKIPESAAAIISAVDAFDAMSSMRVYIDGKMTKIYLMK